VSAEKIAKLKESTEETKAEEVVSVDEASA